MIFEDKFDFCLISNPYNGSGMSIIFITSELLYYIDESIITSKEYRKVKSFLENINFIEIEYCAFEAKDDVSNIENELISKLESRGLRYSKSLEIKINKEVDGINKHLEPINLFPNMFNADSVLNDQNKLNPLPVFNIPSVGEKITLYFYLSLECHFINEEDCVLLLSAEMQTSENNYYRNFLKITKADFVRIHSDSANSIVLQSVKQYNDFIKEISILHRGKFKLIQPYLTEIGQRGYKTKEYKYNFVEIKKNINPENHIIIQTSPNWHYDQMIERSKSIKRELSYVGSRKITIESIKEDIKKIKTNLENKMFDFAELDEYERASYFKKNIVLLDNKLEIVNNINEENMSLSDYMKIFTLN